MAEPLRTLPPTLRRTLIPVSPMIAGAQWVPRADTVLRHLAVTGDEREWQRMIENSDAISSAIEQRTSGLLHDGFHIVEGGGNNSTSAELRDFAQAAFSRRGLELSTVLREMLDAVFLGWRPIEVLWDTEETFNSRPALLPRKLIAHPPWEFKWTVDGQLAHVVQPLRPQLFDLSTQENSLRWLICQSGESRSPYGRSWLSRLWLLWFVSNEFQKMSSKAVSRALGIFKAVRGQKSAIGETAAATDPGELTRELAAVIEVLDSTNMLIEGLGWSFEHMGGPGDAAVNGIETMQRFYDEKLRIAIVGQNLTSSVGITGSRAAAEVHLGILTWYWHADGRLLSGWMNTLTASIIDANFGPQLAADYPVWMLSVFSKPDLAATTAFYNMGGTVDGRALAQRLNVPFLESPAAHDLPLVREKGDPVIGTGQQGMEDQAGARDRAGGGVLRESAELDTLVGGFDAEALERLYQGMAERVTGDNPDPPPALSD